MKYDKWIQALGKYEKNTGYFVGLIPKNGTEEYDEHGEFDLKPNCACVLGVYLIEFKGIPADEIARARSNLGAAQINEYYNLLYQDLGQLMASHLWHLNDNVDGGPEDKTWGKVVEFLRNVG